MATPAKQATTQQRIHPSGTKCVRGASDGLNIALNEKMEVNKVCEGWHFLMGQNQSVDSVETKCSLFVTSYVEFSEERICCYLQKKVTTTKHPHLVTLCFDSDFTENIKKR